ncbi:hypothetical protein ABPG72_015310 [Tetrahymena utriculariae]
MILSSAIFICILFVFNPTINFQKFNQFSFFNHLCRIQYKPNLINKVFGFQYSLHEEQANQTDNSKDQGLRVQTLDQNIEQNNYYAGGNKKQHTQKTIYLDVESQNFSNNQILSSKSTQPQQKQSVNEFLKQQEVNTNKNDKNLKTFFEQTFEQIKIKSFDYLKYYLSFIACKKAKISYAIEYGVQKLQNHIDIVKILNKLIEFEKLKRFLLNDNQLKLFDYIPKPIIKVNKLTGEIITQSNSNNDIDIFFEDNRSQLQKAEDAQEAYNNIFNSDKDKQQLDEKLISLLHPKLIELFNQQQFDRQKNTENRKYLIKQRNSKLNSQSRIKKASFSLELNKYQQYLMQDSKNYLTEQQPQIQRKPFSAIKVKQLKLSFTNISTDTGIVMEDIKDQTDLTFSSDREQVVSKKGNRLFLLQISLDPNKQINYSRKYLTISQGLSQIGGIYNILFAIAYFIKRPYAQLQYKHNLMNKVFGFEYSDEEQQNKEEEEKNSKSNKDCLEKQFTDQEDQNANHFESKTKQNSTRARNKSLNFTDKSVRFTVTQKEKENGKGLKKFFKQTFKQLRIKSYYYLSYYLSVLICRKQKRSQVIYYGLQKLYNHLDIVYILNKLIEFEKLKKFLLNENQLRLFDYIPKPIIKLNKYTNQINQNDSQDLNNVGIFYVDKRTLIQKAEDAQEAYNVIVNQSQQNSELNHKLINLLHPKLIELFKSQSFDRHDWLKDKSPSFRFKKINFQLLIPILSPTINNSERNLYHSIQKRKSEYQQVLNTQQPEQASVKDIQISTRFQQDTDDLNPDQMLNEYEVCQIPNKKIQNLNENK